MMAVYKYMIIYIYNEEQIHFDEVQYAIFPLRLMFLLPYIGNNFYTEIMQIWAYFFLKTLRVVVLTLRLLIQFELISLYWMQ